MGAGTEKHEKWSIVILRPSYNNITGGSKYVRALTKSNTNIGRKKLIEVELRGACFAFV
jgi:hypothetical protein